MRADRSIIGQTFGLITVLDFGYTESNKAFWRCKCNGCGKEVVIRTDMVKTGRHSFCEYFNDTKNKALGPLEIADFKHILANAIKAAKELGYSEECIADLKISKTEGEIERIMIRARHGGYKTNGKS